MVSAQASTTERGGATLDRRALMRRTQTIGGLAEFLAKRAASPYRDRLAELLAHHERVWKLHPGRPFWQRAFAGRVNARLADAVRVAANWIVRIHDGDAAYAKRLLAMYQLKVAEELRGTERELFYRHCSLEAAKDDGGGADAVSRRVKACAVGVVLACCAGIGYFLLFFGRAYADEAYRPARKSQPIRDTVRRECSGTNVQRRYLRAAGNYGERGRTL